MNAFIVNADDFGLNRSCTDAIAEAFAKKLITDTTMVANGEAFDHAVELIGKLGLENRVGIHFNLTEGKPLTEDIKKYASFCKDGQFHGKIHRLKCFSAAEKLVVYDELSAQADKLLKAGVKISHADSHHHVHTIFPLMSQFVKVCHEFHMQKVRLHRNIGNIVWYKLWGKKFYNYLLHREGFITTKYFGSADDLPFIKKSENVTEIMVHPGYDSLHQLIDIKEYNQRIPCGVKLSEIISESILEHLKSYCQL